MMGVKFYFSEEQVKWLKENYADTPNAEVRNYLKCGETTLRTLVKKYGLAKSEAFVKWREERSRKALRKYYQTHKPTDNSAYIRPYCFKKGNDPKALGQKFWDGIEKARVKRNQTIREDKARITFGLPQKTKMKLIQQPRAKVHQRYYLKKCGYILDEEKRIAYYSPDTRRAFKIETRQNKRNYYTFKEYELAI